MKNSPSYWQMERKESTIESTIMHVNTESPMNNMHTSTPVFFHHSGNGSIANQISQRSFTMHGKPMEQRLKLR